MTRIVTYLAGFSFLAVTALSCTKEAQHETRQQAQTPEVIKANVPAEQTYVLNMGAASTVKIEAQAQHYQLSEVATSADGNTVYTYTGAKGFSGADEVMLQQTITSSSSTSQGNGCSNSQTNGYSTTTIKTIVIKFEVAN